MSMDYLSFFNLSEDPFKITPDPSYFYPSNEHNEILSSLHYSVEQNEGFFLATGEPGTGKTIILKVFMNHWKDKAEIALIMTPRLSPEEFLLAVLEDFNIPLKNTINKNEIIKAFRDFLIERSIVRKKVIIIVDEAHMLPDETLEELRLLSNLETEKEKLLQIVLIGQPELRKRLLSENLKQLYQRITIRTTLMPLTMDESSDYINYRLIKAGKGNVTFEETAKKLIHKSSRGIPRLINLLSSRALMAAYVDGCKGIKKKHIVYAIQHLSDGYLKTRFKTVSLKYTILICLSICVITLAIFIGYNLAIMFPKTATRDSALLSLTHKKEIKRLMRKRKLLQGDKIAKSQSRIKDVKDSESEKKEGKTVSVIVDSVSLRAKPSLDGEVITETSKETMFEVLDEFGEVKGGTWYKVKTSTGRECWIAGKEVRLLP